MDFIKALNNHFSGFDDCIDFDYEERALRQIYLDIDKALTSSADDPQAYLSMRLAMAEACTSFLKEDLDYIGELTWLFNYFWIERHFLRDFFKQYEIEKIAGKIDAALLEDYADRIYHYVEPYGEFYTRDNIVEEIQKRVCKNMGCEM